MTTTRRRRRTRETTTCEERRRTEEAMGRAAGLWQDWEQEAIYRMRRTGQSWEDINTAVPERTLPAIKKLWYTKLCKKSPEEMGLPADLPNAEEDAKKGDVEDEEERTRMTTTTT